KARIEMESKRNLFILPPFISHLLFHEIPEYIENREVLIPLLMNTKIPKADSGGDLGGVFHY
ncbi:hypothetical protein KAX35_03715, partial [candidate division WOR-3 bacterium]|nr:hypothetical protein [candidate division WOR-3 bacterium]